MFITHANTIIFFSDSLMVNRHISTSQVLVGQIQQVTPQKMVGNGV